MEPTPNTSKLGKRGQVIHSQAREVIASVIDFMEREAEYKVEMSDKTNVLQRVMSATGISKNTYYRIKKEKCDIVVGNISRFTTPHKIRHRKSRKSDLDEFSMCAIRKLIHNYPNTEKGSASFTKIHKKVLEAGIEFDGGLSTFTKIVKRLGFTCSKTSHYKRLIIEKHDVRMQRITYIRRIKQYRKENRPIIYTNKTHIDTNTTNSKSSSKPRLVIVQAANQNGFVPYSQLIFQSDKKEPKDDINFENYSQWLQTQLIPNLPSNSVLIVESASYNNIKIERPPTRTCKKEELKKWLDERGIIYDNSYTKPELYDLVKRHKPSYDMFKLEQILAEHGHTILRLPPNHPDLNPVKKMSALVKDWVAVNITAKLTDVEQLARVKFSMVDQQEWKTQFDNVIEVEDDYLEREHNIDEHIESFISQLSSDEEDDSDYLDDDDYDDHDDDLRDPLA